MSAAAQRHNYREAQREFESLVARYRSDLYRVALQYTRSPDDAEDLLQEAFTRAYAAFDRFRRGTNFKAWMLRILRNAHINGHRQSLRRPNVVAMEDLELEEDRWLIDPDLSREVQPEQATLEKIPAQEIEEALLALPEEFRQVVVLSDIKDLSYEDISRVLHIPIGTVRSRLFRGRRRLRTSLEGFAREHGYVRDSDVILN